MRTYRKYRDVLIDDLRNDPEHAHAYLQVALEEFEEDGDTRQLMVALRNVAEAQGGVPALAKKVKMGKTSLYKALSEEGNPRLSTIYAILHGLGYKLMLAPRDKERDKESA